MTEDEARERVEKIRRMADDDEAAHSEEDAFHHDVLSAIAERQCDSPAALATIALQTLDIDFARWCA